MRGRGLGLAAYQTWARGTHRHSDALPLPKADGPMLWAHADGAERGRALANLCARAAQQRPELTVVVTGDVPPLDGMRQVALPSDNPADTDPFIATLKPDFLLWADDMLRPSLLQAAALHGCRLLALDIGEVTQTTPAPRWIPDPAPAVLALFDRLHVTGLAAARRLRRLGVDSARIHNSGALAGGGPLLDCPDALRDELSEALQQRPVWLAARLRAEEAADILRAHRRAVRLAHRLLLIAVPQSEADCGALLSAVEDQPMRACDWDSGETPEDSTQVLIAESPEELGLWYRVAPLTFMGGSLVPGYGGTEPFEAASLGTAILYGPNVGRHLAAYTRLVDAGAARIVRDADSLAAAVSHLTAPELAAGMAHAGWDVASDGAALVDAVIEDISEALDARAPA